MCVAEPSVASAARREPLHRLKLHPQAVYPTSAGVPAPLNLVSATLGKKKRMTGGGGWSVGGVLITATLL